MVARRRALRAADFDGLIINSEGPQMILVERSPEAQMAYLEGYRAGLLSAINRLHKSPQDHLSIEASLRAFIRGVEQSMAARTEGAADADQLPVSR